MSYDLKQESINSAVANAGPNTERIVVSLNYFETGQNPPETVREEKSKIALEFDHGKLVSTHESR